MSTKRPDLSKMSKDKKRNLYEHVYKALALGALVLLATGTVAYRALEEWSWVDSLYFSVVAVTTVGFGDLSPTTDASKLFTVFYILVGITIITTYLNQRFKYLAYERMDGMQNQPSTGSSDERNES